MLEVKLCSSCGGELRLVSEFLKYKIGVSKGWLGGGAELQTKECKLYQCVKCMRLDVKE